MRRYFQHSFKSWLRISYWIIALINLALGISVVLLKGTISNWLSCSALALLIVFLINLLIVKLLIQPVIQPIQLFRAQMRQLASDEETPFEIQPSDPLELQDIKQSLKALLEKTKLRLEELRLFVANASHELRTPLTTIRLRVEALRDGAIHDITVSDKFLQEIEAEVDGLSKMVTDLLDLSRIESGISDDLKTELDLSSITRDVCAMFEMRAKQAAIQLECTNEKDLPKIVGIEEQLRRMLYNLVDNAIKYNRPGGKVAVELHRARDPDRLQLVVTDSGFGIPSAYLPHIFERFYRAEATRPRSGISRGSGLGLAIVKAIVDLHGAEISIKSELGKGTQIIITFPLGAC